MLRLLVIRVNNHTWRAFHAHRLLSSWPRLYYIAREFWTFLFLLIFLAIAILTCDVYLSRGHLKKMRPQRNAVLQLRSKERRLQNLTRTNHRIIRNFICQVGQYYSIFSLVRVGNDLCIQNPDESHRDLGWAWPGYSGWRELSASARQHAMGL